ncbi:MAG: anhydro-N-acetylmuramic acid kinase [Gammaproteobacteria bacterium]|nr:anhydro-N-acetylmuramic acid kinase [Gammaproteobacteria bacterium]
MNKGLYLGIMSGTSMDGIDASLVELHAQGCTHVASHSHPWATGLQQQLRSITHPGENEIERMGILDIMVAEEFAHCALALLQQAGVNPEQVAAIGSHGQTIRHRPNTSTPFTLQIGDPSRIAELTGITTVADFRRRDMAAGGQGAPLVCAFHQAMFQGENENRAVVNIGGIANITLLPSDSQTPISGFDTGPGNTLLDGWVRRHCATQYDDSGSWAAGGNIDQPLLDKLLNTDYLRMKAPKSTGPEQFNLAWLDSILNKASPLDPRNVQATLCSFTAATISQAIINEAPECTRVIACGGGVHNRELMRRLQMELGSIRLETSSAHGIDPDHVEAVAFAWLARQTIQGLPGNIPGVTGATGPRILGGIYPGGTVIR